MWISVHCDFLCVNYSSVFKFSCRLILIWLYELLDAKSNSMLFQLTVKTVTSLVQSVVLYGSETWTMRKVDSDRIQSFHMQALRRILSIRWYDKVPNAVVNERTKLQTSFIIWSHLSPTGEHICFAGTATVNRSPHQHSSHHWLEAPARSSMKKLAATSGRRHWPICWCCPDRSMWRTLRPSAGQAQQWVSNSWVVNLQQILQRNWLRWLMSLTTTTASE